MILEIDPDRPEMFDEKVLTVEFAIVDFHASWCAPCKIFKKIFIRFAEKLKAYPQIKLFTINSDKHPEICYKYNVASVPTLIYFKNGRVFKSVSGIQTEEQMVVAINEMKKS